MGNMRYHWSLGQAICTLAVVGILLALVNLLLLSKLNQQEKIETNSDLFVEFSRKSLDFNSLPIDSSGQYRIQHFFVTPNFVSKRGLSDVTLVTHCTVNHLYYLIEMSAVWKGPISVALLVPGADVISAYRVILRLHRCMATIKHQVAFHLVYPLSHPPEYNNLEQYLKKAFKVIPNCDEFLPETRNEGKQDSNWNYANVKVPYPNNLLRNTALRNTITDYVFVVDVDMACSSSLYHDFLEFADRQKLFNDKTDKTVFVVPAFESKHKLDQSIDKQKLINLWNKGLVQPFYYTVCWKCQKHTDYEKWKNSNSKELQIAYSVQWKDPWEPFYIGPKHIPLYDERFKQYGFNRISQVCETHVAGYRFVVLNNGFLVHHGFKKKENFHSSKEMENARNRELFRKFKRELKTKYPESLQRC